MHTVQTHPEAVQIFPERKVRQRKEDVAILALERVHLPQKYTRLHGRYQPAERIVRPRKHTQVAITNFSGYHKQD